LSQLATLFAQYGVEPFLESTGLFVVLLDLEGTLLSWNPSFDSFKQVHTEKARLSDVLSSSSTNRFEELLSISVQQRIRTKGELEFAGATQNSKSVY
jgi:hypothetical protein